MIATVRGWLTHDSGGRLESVETGVALLVPPRALPPGPAAHLVYFKVCRQDHVRPVDTNGVPLDDGKQQLPKTNKQTKLFSSSSSSSRLSINPLPYQVVEDVWDSFLYCGVERPCNSVSCCVAFSFVRLQVKLYLVH